MAGLLQSAIQASTQSTSTLTRGGRLTSALGSVFFGGLKTGAKGIWKGATAGPLGRTAFGAGVGAVGGYLGSDYESPTLTLGAMAKGAAFGGLLGGFTASAPMMAKGAWRLNRAIGRRFGRSPLGIGTGMGWRVTKMAGRGVMGVAGFAWRHPVLTAGTIGAGAGAIGIANRSGQELSSPTLTGVSMQVNYNNQAAAARELQMAGLSPMGAIGPAPQMMGPMHRAMMNSTQGLVQGLSRGRHG